MKTGLLTTLIALMVLAPVIQAGWIECDLLQIKNDRLYFSVGEDDLVFQHSKFAIICDDDTLATGRIEESALGVCYTTPEDSILTILDSCGAFVETADVDSVSEIWANVISPGLPPGALMNSDIDAGFVGTNRLRWSRSGAPGIERFDRNVETGWTSGRITPDVMTSLYRQLIIDPGSGGVNAPAPIIAALIPNLSMEVNEDGLLSTSLYYRSGSSALPNMFDGDEVQSSNSFIPGNSDAHRPYPYHPARGRRLLDEHPQRPDRVSVYSGDEGLIRVSEFLIDVLSRDRIRAEMAQAPPEADIQIAYVPIDSDVPWSTLCAVHDLLAENEPRTRSQREAMELADAYINTAANSTDSATTMRFCKLAEQVLIHDLSAFPLFRPTLYLYTSPSIRGLGFDKDGRLDISNMVKLKLPQPEEGDTE